MARFGAEGALNADAVGIAAREQGGATSAANGLGGIEVGETAALTGHALKVGCLERASERSDVGIAEVIGEDDDDIGGRGRGLFGFGGVETGGDSADCDEKRNEIPKSSRGHGHSIWKGESFRS